MYFSCSSNLKRLTVHGHIKSSKRPLLDPLPLTGQDIERGQGRDEDSDSDSDSASTSQITQQEELSLYTACGYKRVPIHTDSIAIKRWNNDFKNVTSQVSRDLRETVSPSRLKDFLLRQSHILYLESKYIDPLLLTDADSVPKVFDVLSPMYMNFLNLRLLLRIAETFSPQSRHTIEEYTSRFPPSTRLKTLPDPLSLEEIMDLHDWTLGDVWQLQEALEKATGIDKTFLPFAYWESSYSEHNFTFLIPASATGIPRELCNEDLAKCDVRAIDIDYNEVLRISKEVDGNTQQIQEESRVRTKDFGLEHLIPDDTTRQMNREELSRLTDLITSTPLRTLQEGCSDRSFVTLIKG